MSLPTFEVLKPGFMVTIQDRGRFGYQHRGVSMSGALDSFSYRVGNLLVSNTENDASLEITVVGPMLRILQNTVIAVTGANITPMINGVPIRMWTSIKVSEGDTISFGRLVDGCRTYLAVRKGILVPLLLGSRSTNLNSKEGGMEGRPLRAGDMLESEPVEISECKRRSLPSELVPRYDGSITVRVILGPQTRYFERETGINRFLYSEYRVTSEINRSGYRLDGPAIEHKKMMSTSIPSEACCLGGIQVPQNGKPIILLRDQHGGGYAKIAAVISSDTGRVAQLKSGDKIRFKRISVAKAHEIIKHNEKILQGLKVRFGQNPVMKGAHL